MAVANFQQHRPMSIKPVTQSVADLKIKFHRQTYQVARWVSADVGINEATSALHIRDEPGPWLNEVIPKDERAACHHAKGSVKNPAPKNFTHGLEVACEKI